MEPKKARYVWDYDISQEQFDQMLAGRYARGNLDRDWAAVRVIEWAPYEEMVRLIGFPQLVQDWARWREFDRNSSDAPLISSWNGYPRIIRSCLQMPDSSLYFTTLYPFQDDALRLVSEARTGFYLTGVTALSRGYLSHRFSDDLDLFVNFDSHFREWSERV